MLNIHLPDLNGVTITWVWGAKEADWDKVPGNESEVGSKLRMSLRQGKRNLGLGTRLLEILT